MGLVEFTLNGVSIDSPKGWEDVQTNASFKSGVQPNITVDEFSFNKDAVAIIDSWVSSYGLLRGCPLTITEEGYVVFEGYLDFPKRFTKVHPSKYIVAVQKNKGLNQLIDSIEGYTFSLLNKNSPLSFSSVPYVVEKKNNGFELALVSVTTLLLLKETYEAIRRVSSAIKAIAVAVANTPFNAGLLIGLALQLIIDIVYTVAIAKALKDSLTKLFNNLISPIRYHKSINVNTALTSFFNTIGYNGYSTGIGEIPKLYYFPSKEVDSKSTGIPSATDYGYLMEEFISILKEAFNAKLAVDNANTVQLRSEKDPYFVRNSTYVMPDIDLESTEYNIGDLKGTRTISFKTDVNDEWTIDNFTGTAYDIYTRTSVGAGENLVKGLKEHKIPVCLGTRKDGLNNLETALKTLGGLLDGLVRTLGGTSNLSNRVTRRIGMIKVSQDNWSEPKLLLLDSSLKLSSNYKSTWSSKVLYDKYHNYNSFVLNSYGGQRAVYKGIEVPFCLKDFKAVVDNSYFKTSDGRTGKFTDLKYGLDQEKATADFWVQETYDTKLTEEYVTP